MSNTTDLINPTICDHIIEQLSDCISGLNLNAIDDIEIIGKKIYQNNPNMKELGEFMEHPVTKNFYEKYLGNWADATVAILNLKLYRMVDKLLKKHNVQVNGYHKIAIVHTIMSKAEVRHLLCKEMSNWIQSTNLNSNNLQTPKIE